MGVSNGSRCNIPVAARPACAAQGVQARKKLRLSPPEQQALDPTDPVSAQSGYHVQKGMDENATETHLSVLWGGNENYSNTDLSRAALQDKSGRGPAGCVSKNLNLKTQSAVLDADGVVRPKNEQNRQDKRPLSIFVTQRQRNMRALKMRTPARILSSRNIKKIFS